MARGSGASLRGTSIRDDAAVGRQGRLDLHAGLERDLAPAAEPDFRRLAGAEEQHAGECGEEHGRADREGDALRPDRIAPQSEIGGAAASSPLTYRPMASSSIPYGRSEDVKTLDWWVGFGTRLRLDQQGHCERRVPTQSSRAARA